MSKRPPDDLGRSAAATARHLRTDHQPVMREKSLRQEIRQPQALSRSKAVSGKQDQISIATAGLIVQDVVFVNAPLHCLFKL